MASKTLKFRFTATTGFFEHDNGPPKWSSPDEATTSPGLGLINRSYETDATFDPNGEKQPWERFTHYLNHLNNNGNPNIIYKLFYTARHGEGYHNVMEAKVGTDEWERYWAKLPGDGTITWADAHLTPLGTSQAQSMSTFWSSSATALALPLPPRHYASPLTRCLTTCHLAFSNLTLPPPHTVPPFRPTIKELARERLGVHTCDRRSLRSEIAENNPGFTFEEGFSEEDELWRADVRETLEEHVVRVNGLLEDLFESEEAQIVSLTVHSGTILALFETIGHPEVKLAPGTIFPVLVRGEVVGE